MGVKELNLGLKRSPKASTPKNGCKLLLGKKHTLFGEIMSQEGDYQKGGNSRFREID